MKEFPCPECGNLIRLKFLKAGETAYCKQCGSNVLVPGEGEEPRIVPGDGSSEGYTGTMTEESGQSGTHTDSPPSPYAFGCIGGVIGLVIGVVVSNLISPFLALIVIVAGPIIGIMHGIKLNNQWAAGDAKERVARFDPGQVKPVIEQMYALARQHKSGKLSIGPRTGKNLPAGISQDEYLENIGYELVGRFGISDSDILDTIRQELEQSKQVFVIHEDQMKAHSEYYVYSRLTGHSDSEEQLADDTPAILRASCPFCKAGIDPFSIPWTCPVCNAPNESSPFDTCDNCNFSPRLLPCPTCGEWFESWLLMGVFSGPYARVFPPDKYPVRFRVSHLVNDLGIACTGDISRDHPAKLGDAGLLAFGELEFELPYKVEKLVIHTIYKSDANTIWVHCWAYRDRTSGPPAESQAQLSVICDTADGQPRMSVLVTDVQMMH